MTCEATVLGCTIAICLTVCFVAAMVACVRMRELDQRDSDEGEGDDH
jgi:hypothetical protein